MSSLTAVFPNMTTAWRIRSDSRTRTSAAAAVLDKAKCAVALRRRPEQTPQKETRPGANRYAARLHVIHAPGGSLTRTRRKSRPRDRRNLSVERREPSIVAIVWLSHRPTSAKGGCT
jgi:hypothetical protein